MEYRGYDSAGLAIIHKQGELARARRTGKVQSLADAVKPTRCQAARALPTRAGPPTANPPKPTPTRTFQATLPWCITASSKLRKPAPRAARPRLCLYLKTDTEVIAHLVERELKRPKPAGRRKKVRKLLRGAYGMVVLDSQQPERMVVARSGGPW